MRIALRLSDETKCDAQCFGHCWDDDHCQTMRRLRCRQENAHGGACAQTGNCHAATQCCHSACLSGCSGPTEHDCAQCHIALPNGTCVHECPNRLYMYHKYSMIKQSGNTMYQQGRKCVHECDATMYYMWDRCVHQCPNGYTVRDEDRTCIPCTAGQCPIVCSLDYHQPLTDATMRAIVDNCTELHGSLVLNEYYMSKVDMHELRAKLRYIRRIRGHLHVYGDDGDSDYASMTAFDLLPSLERIDGVTRTARSLIISHMAVLEHVHLYALRRIDHGNMFIGYTPALQCYVNTLNWTAILLDGGAIVPNACNSEGGGANETATSECNTECVNGCWDREHCFDCAHNRNGNATGECVRDCANGTFADASQICTACHSLCITCNGPTEYDCVDCVNRLNGQCIGDCPPDHYRHTLDTVNGQCRPCHTECSGECTGPTALYGPTGCTKCEYLLNHTLCTHTPCARGYYARSSMYYTNATYNATFMCEPCAPGCAECTSGGSRIDGDRCRCTRIVVHTRAKHDECQSECP